MRHHSIRAYRYSWIGAPRPIAKRSQRRRTSSAVFSAIVPKVMVSCAYGAVDRRVALTSFSAFPRSTFWVKTAKKSQLGQAITSLA
jgi:hypothetical protein